MAVTSGTYGNVFDQFEEEDKRTAAAPSNAYDRFAHEDEADITIGIGGRLKDIARGVVGGARDGIQGAVDTGLMGMEAVSGVVDKVTGGNPAATSAAYAGIRSKLTFSEVEQNQTVLGEFTRQVVKFGLGFKAAGTVIKGGGMLGMAGKGAVGDFVVSDPHEARLADLVQNVTGLEDPITTYLRSNEDDSAAEGKFKAALEGVVVGTMIDVVFRGVKAIRAANKLRAAGKAAEADALIEAATPKISQVTDDALKSDVDVSIFKPSEPAIPGVYSADTEGLLSQMKFTKALGDTADVRLEGVINYARYDTDESVLKLLSDVVTVGKRDLPNLGGTHQTVDYVKALAHDMGQDPTSLFSRLNAAAKGTEDLAATVQAGHNLVKRIAEDVDVVAQKLINGMGTEQDKVGFAHMTDILSTVMDKLSGIQTAAARATGMNAHIRVTGGITSENFAALLEKVGGSEAVMALASKVRMAGGNPAGIIGAIKGTTTADKLTAIHNQVWINGLLSGVKTTAVNVFTTGVNTLAMPGFRVVGGLLQAATGNAEGMEQAWRGVAQYQMLRYTFKDAVSMARKSFLSNESILDQAGNPLAQGRVRNALSTAALSAPSPGGGTSVLGTMAGRVDSFIEAETGIKEGIGWIGTLVGSPGRFLTAQDELFKQISYRAHVMSSASVEGAKQGLDGAALKTFVDDKLAASIGKLGEGLDKPALMAARMATFTQDLKAASHFSNRTVSEIVSSAAQSHPIVKALFLPFIKVPANLLRQSIDMTPPLAIFRKQVITDIKAGGEAGAMALGKMGAGTMLWGSAFTLGVEGRLTGSGPRDPDLRRQLGPDWQPYSVVFTDDATGKKSYISFARFDPFGVFFGVAADLVELSGKFSEEEKGELAIVAALSLVRNFNSKTYLRGLTEALDALGSSEEKAVKRWAQSRIASYVPGIVGLVQPDDDMKSLRGLLDGMKSRVPGWSASVEAKRDNFGEKISAPMGYPYSAINPFTMKQGTDDPVRKELAALALTQSEAKFTLPNPANVIKGVDLRDILKANGQSAYDRWLELHATEKIGGRTLHQSISALIASPAYKAARERMGDGDSLYRASVAVDMLRKQFEMYERVTKLKMLREYPGLGKAEQKLKLGTATTRGMGSNDPKNPALSKGALDALIRQND